MLLPIKLTDGVVKNIDGDPQQLLCIGLLRGMEIKSAQSSIIYPMSMVTEIQYNQSTNKMHLICDMCLFQLIWLPCYQYIPSFPTLGTLAIAWQVTL